MDADHRFDLLDTALHNRVYAEIATDTRQIVLCRSKVESGERGNDFHSRRTRQPFLNALGDSMTEIILIRIGTQIQKWQNSNRVTARTDQNRFETATFLGCLRAIVAPKRRHIAARPKQDQNRVGSAFTFVVLRKLTAKPLSFRTHNRIYARIEISPPIEDLPANHILFDACRFAP